MSSEDELLRLARERDRATEVALVEMALERPDHLRRQLRAYLSRKLIVAGSGARTKGFLNLQQFREASTS